MNGCELLKRILLGNLVIVGEVRAANVKESGIVDRKTGLKSSVWLIIYFVELMRDNGCEMAKITRRISMDSPDPSTVVTGTERGRCYAFEVDCVERKNGMLWARMSSTEPAQIDAEGAVPVAAPSGAATGTAL